MQPIHIIVKPRYTALRYNTKTQYTASFRLVPISMLFLFYFFHNLDIPQPIYTATLDIPSPSVYRYTTLSILAMSGTWRYIEVWVYVYSAVNPGMSIYVYPVIHTPGDPSSFLSRHFSLCWICCHWWRTAASRLWWRMFPPSVWLPWTDQASATWWTLLPKPAARHSNSVPSSTQRQMQVGNVTPTLHRFFPWNKFFYGTNFSEKNLNFSKSHFPYQTMPETWISFFFHLY